jgi:hypothetical protein
MEEPFHSPRVAGGDSNFLGPFKQFADPLVSAGRHFTEVGDTLKIPLRFAEFLENQLLRFDGNDLRKGAAAIQDFGGRVAHGEGGGEVETIIFQDYSILLIRFQS